MEKMEVSRTNGWTVDTVAGLLSWPTAPDGVDKAPRVLLDVTLGALVYFGLGYLESQAAARTVNDHFRKIALAALRANGSPDAKLSDVKGDVVPKSDTAEYRDVLRQAHVDLFEKLCEGYEVGVREGSTNPYDDEVDKVARMWLYGIARQYKHNGVPWYVLPGKKKVPADSDPYNDPKGRYATFGDALAAFIESNAPVTPKLTGKNSKTGQAWPFKIKAGSTVAEAISHEAQRRVDERAEGKPSVTLGGGDGDVEI